MREIASAPMPILRTWPSRHCRPGFSAIACRISDMPKLVIVAWVAPADSSASSQESGLATKRAASRCAFTGRLGITSPSPMTWPNEDHDRKPLEWAASGNCGHQRASAALSDSPTSLGRAVVPEVMMANRRSSPPPEAGVTSRGAGTEERSSKSRIILSVSASVLAAAPALSTSTRSPLKVSRRKSRSCSSGTPFVPGRVE